MREAPEQTGASDDLIEIEGDIREEFSALHNGPDDASLLAFSDGTVLRIHFNEHGTWRIAPVYRGTGTLTIDQAAEGDGATDKATLTGPITWVVHGINHAGGQA